MGTKKKITEFRARATRYFSLSFSGEWRDVFRSGVYFHNFVRDCIRRSGELACRRDFPTRESAEGTLLLDSGRIRGDLGASDLPEALQFLPGGAR